MRTHLQTTALGTIGYCAKHCLQVAVQAHVVDVVETDPVFSKFLYSHISFVNQTVLSTKQPFEDS
jgi:hypothetical protein